MANVVLVSTTDVKRAVQSAFERWRPVLSHISEATLLPRASSPDGSLPPELLEEVISQIRRFTPRPISILAQRKEQITRDWVNLAELQAVQLFSFDQIADSDLVDATGSRMPRMLGPEAFTVDLIEAAELSEKPFHGLALADPSRYCRGAAAASPSPWKPSLVILNAIDAVWPGASHSPEILALSDNPMAIDLVAVALYRIFRGRGGPSEGPLLQLSPFQHSGARSALPLQFDTEGRTAGALRREIEGLLAGL